MLAENALTTVERMKLMLGLPAETDDRTNLIVEMLINKASSWVERQIGLLTQNSTTTHRRATSALFTVTTAG